MIFVDTNVFMYAVGRSHPLRAPAQQFFVEANRSSTPLCTSAEVMQELAHAYLPAGRLQTLDAALTLIARAAVEVWPLEEEDVALARRLHGAKPHPAGEGPLPPGQLPATWRERDQDLRPGIGSRVRWPLNAVESQALNLAFADRERYVGDPDFVDLPSDKNQSSYWRNTDARPE